MRGQVESPHTALEKMAGGEDKYLRVDTSPENLARIAQLRNPARVGKEQYGEGLVNASHKGAKTVAEHEAAQARAYNAADKKIEAGLVDPAAIGTEIVVTLGVSPEIDNPPQTHAEIPGRVGDELDSFVEQKKLTQEEADIIKKEVSTFSALYHEAYPEADATKAYELVRNNARTIAYQTVRDKTVFSGSDHGVKHILQGNMTFAEQMFASMEAQGIKVSAKDKILTHQTIIDHDCGYTCGCGQAPSGFEASKDHPVFSAKFVEANKGYYTDKFGEDGYTVVQDAILNHSYPTELPQSLAPDTDVHPALIRSISSTVDSLGVTADTKTPLFFTNPDSIRVLLKIKLASDTLGNGGDIPKELMEKYKGELRAIARREPNLDRQQGYVSSIDNFFSEFTADTTLGHYTGVVDSVGVARLANGKLGPQVGLKMSRIHAILGDMFGGKTESQAFTKAMGDLGMSKGEMQRLGAILTAARKNGERPSSEQLQFDSEQARFVLAPELAENAQNEFTAVSEVMDEVYNLSIRMDINRLIDSLPSNTEHQEGAIAEIQFKFFAAITEKTSEADIDNLHRLTADLSDNSDSVFTFTNNVGEIKQLTRVEVAKQELKRYITAEEKKFLGIEDAAQ